MLDRPERKTHGIGIICRDRDFESRFFTGSSVRYENEDSDGEFALSDWPSDRKSQRNYNLTSSRKFHLKKTILRHLLVNSQCADFFTVRIL